MPEYPAERHATQDYRIGDRVCGAISGAHERDAVGRGHTHHGSASAPWHEIESDGTEHVAVHKSGTVNALPFGLAFME